MDGGTGGGPLEAGNRILTTIKEIDGKYGEGWQFDYWVVTHWDLDHYEGMIDLLTKNNWNNFTPDNKRLGVNGFKQYFKGNGSAELLSGAECLPTYKDVIREAGLKSDLFGQGLVGIDLFTRKKVFKSTSGEEWDKKQKVSYTNEFTGTERPAFCVIGAGGYVIGHSAIHVANPNANETSVLGLLFWPSSGNCSYFTGGDGNPKAEYAALSNLRSREQIKKTVSVIKLDHHGSSKEFVWVIPKLKGVKGSKKTSSSLVEYLEPKAIVVTPGDKFGHPVWDVVQKIFNDYYDKKAGSNSPKLLYTTRLHYWAYKTNLKQGDFNLGKFYENQKLQKDSILHKWTREMSISDEDEQSPKNNADYLGFLAEEAPNIFEDNKQYATFEKSREDVFKKAPNLIVQYCCVFYKSEDFEKIQREILTLYDYVPKSELDDLVESPEESEDDIFKEYEELTDYCFHYEDIHDIQKQGLELTLENAINTWNILSVQHLDEKGHDDPYSTLILTSTENPKQDGSIDISSKPRSPPIDAPVQLPTKNNEVQVPGLLDKRSRYKARLDSDSKNDLEEITKKYKKGYTYDKLDQSQIDADNILFGKHCEKWLRKYEMKDPEAETPTSKLKNTDTSKAGKDKVTKLFANVSVWTDEL